MSVRLYPDEQDDAAMDQMEAEFIRRREEEDATRDDEQAEEAMTTPSERLISGNISIMDNLNATLGRKQG